MGMVGRPIGQAKRSTKGARKRSSSRRASTAANSGEKEPHLRGEKLFPDGGLTIAQAEHLDPPDPLWIKGL
jgi:hypothetical protein